MFFNLAIRGTASVLTNTVRMTLPSGRNVRLGRMIHSTAGRLQEKSGTEMFHRPDKWDKLMLVWTKKYPSLKEVPEKVSPSTMDNARNKSRIRINLITMFLTLITCIVIVQSGRRLIKKREEERMKNEE